MFTKQLISVVEYISNITQLKGIYTKSCEH